MEKNIPEYALSAIPDPVQILGLTMKPFCLGHFLLMARFGVAFASDDKVNAGLSDLVMAVLVCSMSYDEFLAFVNTPKWFQEVREWGKEVGSRFNLPEKVKLFDDYMLEASKQPSVVFEGETSESGAHWTQAILATLMASGFTEGQVLNMPMKKAFADFYKILERNGSVRIMDSEDCAELEKHVEQNSHSETPPETELPQNHENRT